MPTTRVVILGAGFAGYSAAEGLERARARLGLDVSIVDRKNYSLFTPMLPEVAGGAVEPRHIAQPVRAGLRHTRFELGDVKGIDFEERTITLTRPLCGGTATLPYDHLVVALGAVSSTEGVPGAQDHSLPLKTLDDAIHLRDRAVTALEVAATTTSEPERRRLLTVVVVGGGFTGVEAAGEILGFLRKVSSQYPNLVERELRVVLVAGSARLLEQLPERFGVRAAHMLAARGVELVFDDGVASVDAGGLTLKSGKRYASDTVVWSAGVRPAPELQSFDVPLSEHGSVEVNADLSVAGKKNVWALGDCARIPKPHGGHYSQTAQDAVREGSHLAKNIAAAIEGRPTSPFTYRSAGMMASLGDRQGLAEIGNVLLSGLPAWILWRGYYLSRLHGVGRKARVALDWTLALPFPRDVARIQ